MIKKENIINELKLHFKKKYSLTDEETINLLLLILSDIFDEEPNKVYKLAETKTK